MYINDNNNDNELVIEYSLVLMRQTVSRIYVYEQQLSYIHKDYQCKCRECREEKKKHN